MITKNEISSLTLSPTKKDFVQIWNELLEVASKITERWDPTSTNESDPGIVLLKVLTGIADKLNYNIDKNILEAYMPTAAQMESMRKLCELVGYDIKYYQSATTKVKIKYVGNTTNLTDENTEKLPASGLALPKFTTITNADKDIAFVTTNTIPGLLTNATPWVIVDCIEGQISQCESSNEHNLITLAQLDDNNRYYLPEVQIAENGIFVYNVTASFEDGTAWKQVSNLNTQPLESRVFKFGYDSFEGRPYLAFPDDVGSLIGDGLFIYFTRTSGLSGNIKAWKLNTLELPTGSRWGDWKDYSAEQFEVIQTDATSNGANIENISAAYNNFKKTVGTFDTLVTCRDYMNKIYSLMDANNSPYVSNILVTDIRNDINSAITLCSCNEFGILYKEMPLYEPAKAIGTLPDYAKLKKLTENGEDINRMYITTGTTDKKIDILAPKIDHFDLLLYPFKTFTQVSSGTKDLAEHYNKSFTYTDQLKSEIEASLADFKTCAHKFKTPDIGDIVSINNYLRLNAHIATSTRVSEIEAKDILDNVKVALVNAFNLRNLDFGEEIPFDSILSVIENADSRIKVVSLQEPTLLTTYSVKTYSVKENSNTSKEYGIASTSEGKIDGVNYTSPTAKELYNKLVLRNILAGRASLFNYDETFIANNSEKPYTITQNITDVLKLAKKATEYESIQAAFEYFNEILKKDENLSTPEELDIKNAINNAKNLNLFNEEAFNNAEKIWAVGKEVFKDKPIGVTQDYILYDNIGPIKGFSEGIVTLKATPEELDPNTGELIDLDIVGAYETFEPGFDVEPVEGSTELPEKVKGGFIDNIDHVEASCELENKGEANSNIFQNIKLAKNEVIKFRAPNLITTTTYPAYVYYRFERGYEKPIEANQSASGDSENTTQPATYRLSNTRNTSGDSGNGSYAKVMSLASFITAYATDKGETKVNKDKEIKLTEFFNGLWKKAKDDPIVGIKTFTAASTGVSSGSLQDVLNKAIAVGTAEKDDISGDATIVFTNAEDFRKYLAGELKEFAGRPITPPKLETNPITFMYYPLLDSTMSVWGEYVRDCYSTLYSGKSLTESPTFWRLSVTSGHPMGKYVAESGQRLYAQGGDFLANSVVGTTTYLCAENEVGANPVFSSIPDGADVELRPSNSGTTTEFVGDRLYIHYTPSSTNEDGETVQSEPISKVYESTKDNPIIIKPSGLTLMPSDAVYGQGTSWKKTDVDFGKYGTKNLLALAPNEQIEMRSLSRVILDSPARFYKNFKNEDLERGDPNYQPYSYELKDGEYIFYTDQNTSDAAYYGSGSVITVEGGAKIPEASETVEVSQILEKGLHIVPWSRPELLDGKITITEYQYVTLVEGDTLDALTLDIEALTKQAEDLKNQRFDDTTIRRLTSSNTVSSDVWKPCISNTENPIVYTPAGSETSITLPKIDIPSELGNGRSASWEVRSFLELSTSPGYSQTLRADQAKTANGPVTIKDTIKLHTVNETGSDKVVVITPQTTTLLTDPEATSYEPVSIKLDTIVQSAAGNFKKENSNTSEDSTEADTLISAKVFKEEVPTVIEFDAKQEVTPISNIVSYPADSKNNITDIINNYWTKLDITNALIIDNTDTSSDNTRARALNLNVLIPKDDIFGIFSIYLDVPANKLDKDTEQPIPIPIPGSRVYIDIPKEFGSYKDIIYIFNNKNTESTEDIEYTWWADGIDKDIPNRLYLHVGLNCIAVNKSCNLLIGAEATAEGSIIYDNLRLVKGRDIQGINLELLDFKDPSTDTPTDKALSEKILQDIAKFDKNHEFYYNAPIENSLAIEFDDNIKSFSNPYTLYDVNNVNNDFVVSKLDIKYLGVDGKEGGIRIAKSSKY